MQDYDLIGSLNDDVIKWTYFSRYWPFVRGNHRSPLVFTGGFPSQSPVTQSFDFVSDLRLNKRLGKQSRCRWFEAPSRSLWRHCTWLKGTFTRFGLCANKRVVKWVPCFLCGWDRQLLSTDGPVMEIVGNSSADDIFKYIFLHEKLLYHDANFTEVYPQGAIMISRHHFMS